MLVFRVRNVNEALDNLRRTNVRTMQMDEAEAEWVTRDSRNGAVMEMSCPVSTVYERPLERVSFSRSRDANPFFHLFEAIWIAAGRKDVMFLSMFNRRMNEYSDDGQVFHAAYGYRLRRHFQTSGHVNKRASAHEVPGTASSIDQLVMAARMLRDDPDTRRVVMSIWDTEADFGTSSKDIPCNDTIFLKAREDKEGEWRLHMTVCCRSNDVIWGAYGANVVQFSFLQELIAAGAAMRVGTYTQISDSFHIYADNEAWKRMLSDHDWRCDPYVSRDVRAYPLVIHTDLSSWLKQAEDFCDMVLHSTVVDDTRFSEPFFTEVAGPMWKAWWLYRNTGVSAAIDYLEAQDLRTDWLASGIQWMIRRVRR